MLNAKKATAMMIPRTSAAQKKANKPMETVSSLSTIVIWSTGTLPPMKKCDVISCLKTSVFKLFSVHPHEKPDFYFFICNALFNCLTVQMSY